MLQKLDDSFLAILLIPTVPQIPCTTLLLAQLEIIFFCSMSLSDTCFFIGVWSMHAMPVSCAGPEAHPSGRLQKHIPQNFYLGISQLYERHIKYT